MFMEMNRHNNISKVSNGIADLAVRLSNLLSYYITQSKIVRYAVTPKIKWRRSYESAFSTWSSNVI